MKTIKAKDWSEVPQDYTGIVEWSSGIKGSYKNGKHHREDGPAWIRNYDNYKNWILDGKHIWKSTKILDLTNQIVLSKEKHPEYPTVQVWKILDKDRIYEQIIIPRMEEFILE